MPSWEHPIAKKAYGFKPPIAYEGTQYNRTPIDIKPPISYGAVGLTPPAPAYEGTPYNIVPISGETPSSVSPWNIPGTGVQTQPIPQSQGDTDAATAAYDERIAKMQQELYDWFANTGVDDSIMDASDQDIQNQLLTLNNQIAAFDASLTEILARYKLTLGDLPGRIGEILNMEGVDREEALNAIGLIQAMYQQREGLYNQRHAYDLVANLRDWTTRAGDYQNILGSQLRNQPKGPPMPDWLSQLTGQTSGQAMTQPYRMRLASGQTLSGMTPSQTEGAMGYADYAAGKVKGAPASGEDWLYRSQSLLPTRQPRMSYSWTPSGGY